MEARSHSINSDTIYLIFLIFWEKEYTNHQNFPEISVIKQSLYQSPKN